MILQHVHAITTRTEAKDIHFVRVYFEEANHVLDEAVVEGEGGAAEVKVPRVLASARGDDYEKEEGRKEV